MTCSRVKKDKQINKGGTVNMAILYCTNNISYYNCYILKKKVIIGQENLKIQ